MSEEDVKDLIIDPEDNPILKTCPYNSTFLCIDDYANKYCATGENILKAECSKINRDYLASYLSHAET